MIVFPLCGIADARRNPVGVATQSAFNPGRAEYRSHVVWDATPLGLRLTNDGHSRAAPPRVAEYGNHALGDATPLGLRLNNVGSLLHWSTQGSRVRATLGWRMQPRWGYIPRPQFIFSIGK